MGEKEIMYVYNDIYFEEDLSEVISSLVDDGFNMEEVIGYKIDIAEKEPVLHKNFDIESFMDMVDNNFHYERYDENGDISANLRKVFEKHIDFKALTEELEKVVLYYPNGKKHIITDEDYNNYKGL